MKYYLGIDTGTTSISIVALDGTGKQIESRTIKHGAFITGEFEGSKIQNPERIADLVFSNVDDLVKNFGGEKPSAIGLTGQMHGILYVDKNGKSASPLYTWQDNSGSLSLKNHDGKTACEILKENGLNVPKGYGMGTHLYLQESGKIPGNAVKFTTMSDYIAMRLCGNKSPVLSPDMAAGMGGYDVRNKIFMNDALSRSGVNLSYIPETVKNYEAVGHTKDGVPVICSMGDNQACFMGATGGENSGNVLLLNVGTGSQVSLMIREFSDVHSDIEIRPFGDNYILSGSALCGGRAYAMLEGLFREIAGNDCYGIMNEKAADFLKSCGLGKAWNVDTRFNGTRTQPDITGSITGISAENFCAGAFTVGVIRGIISELKSMYEQMKMITGIEAGSLYVSGNGMRNNEVMRKTASLLFGLTENLARYSEEAASGCALTAAQNKNSTKRALTSE